MVFVADGAETYAALRPLVRSNELTVTAAGALALHDDFTEITRRDIVRAELVILPVVPLLLLLVFGSVVAAAVPFGVGLLAVAGGMAGTQLLSRVTAVSLYAVNVITMVGLAVAIDYSLFIVSRHREESRHRPGGRRLWGGTWRRRAPQFSSPGLTVAVGLLGLYSLGPRQPGIHRAVRDPRRLLRRCSTASRSFPRCWRCWSRAWTPGACRFPRRRWRGWRARLRVGLTIVVMNHPWRVLIPVAAALHPAGLSLHAIRLATSDIRDAAAHCRVAPGRRARAARVPGSGDPAHPRGPSTSARGSRPGRAAGRRAVRSEPLARQAARRPAGRRASSTWIPRPCRSRSIRCSRSWPRPSRAPLAPDHGPPHRAPRGAYPPGREQRRGAQARAAPPEARAGRTSASSPAHSGLRRGRPGRRPHPRAVGGGA